MASNSQMTAEMLENLSVAYKNLDSLRVMRERAIDAYLAQLEQYMQNPGAKTLAVVQQAIDLALDVLKKERRYVSILSRAATQLTPVLAAMLKEAAPEERFAIRRVQDILGVFLAHVPRMSARFAAQERWLRGEIHCVVEVLDAAQRLSSRYVALSPNELRHTQQTLQEKNTEREQLYEAYVSLVEGDYELLDGDIQSFLSDRQKIETMLRPDLAMKARGVVALYTLVLDWAAMQRQMRKAVVQQNLRFAKQLKMVPQWLTHATARP